MDKEIQSGMRLTQLQLEHGVHEHAHTITIVSSISTHGYKYHITTTEAECVHEINSGQISKKTIYQYKYKQEAQLMLTNLHDAFRGQSRSPNSTIPYVSSCVIVTLPLRRAIFLIFDFTKML